MLLMSSSLMKILGKDMISNPVGAPSPNRFDRYLPALPDADGDVRKSFRKTCGRQPPLKSDFCFTFPLTQDGAVSME